MQVTTGYTPRLTSVAAPAPVDTVGARIRWARERLGWVQRELAAKLDTDVQQVSRWENDKYLPRGRRMEQVADVLGVDPGWLLTGQGGFEPPSGINTPPPEAVASFVTGDLGSTHSEWALTTIAGIDWTDRSPTRGNLLDLAELLDSVRKNEGPT
ncbi:MAG: helix-turn-helix transcriptional regulator [Myxococcota bacterium]